MTIPVTFGDGGEIVAILFVCSHKKISVGYTTRKNNTTTPAEAADDSSTVDRLAA